MCLCLFCTPQDAREFWETSQSPLVYKLSGAWESLTAPTEEGLAVATIQKLDPDFILVHNNYCFYFTYYY